MKIESKYLDRFNKVTEDKDTMEGVKLYGDKFLVEVISNDEIRSAGGLILETPSNQRSDTNSLKAKIGIVLMVGAGYYDDDTGEDIPLDLKPGNIVLLSDMGLRYYTTFPGILEYTAKGIALSRETEIHMKFEDADAFEKYQSKLNEGILGNGEAQ